MLAHQSLRDVHWFAEVSISEFTPLSPPCSPWIGNGGELAPVTLETVVGEQGPVVGVLPRTLTKASRPCLN